MADFHPQKLDNPVFLYEESSSKGEKLRFLSKSDLKVEPIATSLQVQGLYPISGPFVWVITSRTVFVVARKRSRSYIFSVHARIDLTDTDGVVVAHTGMKEHCNTTLYVITNRGRILRFTLNDKRNSIEQTTIHEFPTATYNSDLYCIASLKNIIFFTYGSGIIFYSKVPSSYLRFTFQELPIQVPPKQVIRSLQAIISSRSGCTLFVLTQDLDRNNGTYVLNLYRNSHMFKSGYNKWYKLAEHVTLQRCSDDVVVTKTFGERFLALVGKFGIYIFDHSGKRYNITNHSKLDRIRAMVTKTTASDKDYEFLGWLRKRLSKNSTHYSCKNDEHGSYSATSPSYSIKNQVIYLYTWKLDDKLALKSSQQRDLAVLLMDDGTSYSHKIYPFGIKKTDPCDTSKHISVRGYAAYRQHPHLCVVMSYTARLIQKFKITTPTIKPHVTECRMLHSAIPPPALITNLWNTNECLIQLFDFKNESLPMEKLSYFCQELPFKFPMGPTLKFWTPKCNFEYGSLHKHSSGQLLFKEIIPHVCGLQGTAVLEAFDDGLVSISFIPGKNPSTVTDSKTLYSGYHSYSGVLDFRVSAAVVDPNKTFLLITENDRLALYENAKLISFLGDYNPSSAPSSFSDLLVLPMPTSGSLDVCVILFDDYGNVRFYDREFSLRLSIRSFDGIRFRPVVFKNSSKLIMVYNKRTTYLISLDNHQICEVKLPSPPYLIKYLYIDAFSSFVFFVLDVNYNAYIFELEAPYSVSIRRGLKTVVSPGFIPLAFSILTGGQFHLILGISRDNPTRLSLSVFDWVKMHEVARLPLGTRITSISPSGKPIKAIMAPIKGYSNYYNCGLFAIHVCGQRKGVIFFIGLNKDTSQNQSANDSSQFTLQEICSSPSRCIPSFMNIVDNKIALIGNIFEIFEFFTAANSSHNFRLHLNELYSEGSVLNLDGFLFHASMTIENDTEDWVSIPKLWRKGGRDLGSTQLFRLNSESCNIVKGFAFKKHLLPFERSSDSDELKATNKTIDFLEVYSLPSQVETVYYYAILDASNRVSFYYRIFGRPNKLRSVPFYQVKFNDPVTSLSAVDEEDQDIEVLYDVNKDSDGGSTPLFLVATTHNMFLVSLLSGNNTGGSNISLHRHEDNKIDIRMMNV